MFPCTCHHHYFAGVRTGSVPIPTASCAPKDRAIQVTVTMACVYRQPGSFNCGNMEQANERCVVLKRTMAFCEKRNRLTQAYAGVAKTFSDAVATLRTSAEGFDEALRMTEEARRKCIQARSILKDHRDQHGC
jgi:hypothetical protein